MSHQMDLQDVIEALETEHARVDGEGQLIPIGLDHLWLYNKQGDRHTRYKPMIQTLVHRLHGQSRTSSNGQIALVASGQSGAGKTTLIQMILLEIVDQASQHGVEIDTSIVQLLQQINKVLSLFGNAETEMNKSSSRFVCLFKITLHHNGFIKGLRVTTSMLETTKSLGKTTFHSMTTPPDRLHQELSDIPGIDPTLVDWIINIITAIKRLGTLLGTSTELTLEVVEEVAEVLQVRADDLEELLTPFGSGMTAKRDSVLRFLAAELYAVVHDHILNALNDCLEKCTPKKREEKGDKVDYDPAHRDAVFWLLDIFGKEVKHSEGGNGWDQIVINSLNEGFIDLYQKKSVSSIIHSLRSLGVADDLLSDPKLYSNDGNVIDQILSEVFSSLDASKSDRQFSQKLKTISQSQNKDILLVGNAWEKSSFTFRHTFGKIEYDYSGWTNLNRGNDVDRLLTSSTDNRLRSHGLQSTSISSGQNTRMGITLQTKKELFRRLGNTEYHFIHCISPRPHRIDQMEGEGMGDSFEVEFVKSQLESMGVTAALLVAQKGYPMVRLFSQIYEQFSDFLTSEDDDTKHRSNIDTFISSMLKSEESESEKVDDDAEGGGMYVMGRDTVLFKIKGWETFMSGVEEKRISVKREMEEEKRLLEELRKEEEQERHRLEEVARGEDYHRQVEEELRQRQDKREEKKQRDVQARLEEVEKEHMKGSMRNTEGERGDGEGKMKEKPETGNSSLRELLDEVESDEETERIEMEHLERITERWSLDATSQCEKGGDMLLEMVKGQGGMEDLLGTDREGELKGIEVKERRSDRDFVQEEGVDESVLSTNAISPLPRLPRSYDMVQAVEQMRSQWTVAAGTEKALEHQASDSSGRGDRQEKSDLEGYTGHRHEEVNSTHPAPQSLSVPEQVLAMSDGVSEGLSSVPLRETAALTDRGDSIENAKSPIITPKIPTVSEVIEKASFYTVFHTNTDPKTDSLQGGISRAEHLTRKLFISIAKSWVRGGLGVSVKEIRGELVSSKIDAMVRGEIKLALNLAEMVAIVDRWADMQQFE